MIRLSAAGTPFSRDSIASKVLLPRLPTSMTLAISSIWRISSGEYLCCIARRNSGCTRSKFSLTSALT